MACAPLFVAPAAAHFAAPHLRHAFAPHHVRYACVRRRMCASIAPSTQAKLPESPVRPPGAGPSAEFLSVSGTLATGAGAALVALLCVTPAPLWLHTTPHARLALTAASSFFYTLSMCQFNLGASRRLALTITLAVISRAVLIPLCSLSLATVATRFGHSLMSLPAPTLSSLSLLASVPPAFAAPLAALAPFVYPTLLAHLCVASLLLAPFLALFSHSLCVLAARLVPVLGAGLGAAYCPVSLFLATTAPSALALALYRVLPRRVSAPVAFTALPVAWASAVALLSVVARLALSEPVAAGFGASALVLSCVVVVAALVARAISNALALELRVRRTLTLYFCASGALIAGTAAPTSFAAAPYAAAAVVGVLVCSVLAQTWNNVIVQKGSES